MGIDTMATSKGNGLAVGAGQAQRWQTFVNGQELGTGSNDPGTASVTGTPVHVSIILSMRFDR